MRSTDWAIGVDLGGTKINLARVDRTGAILERTRVPTRAELGPEAVVRSIVDGVGKLGGGPLAEATGLGIGVAGQVDPSSGAVRFAPNLDWTDVPLGVLLSSSLELPVVVTNDVRAAAVGEWRFGAGTGCEDLVCLFVGTGVGGGIVTGGRLVEGCSNTAGEVGHMTVDIQGRICGCGNRGCLETLIGGWAIAERAAETVVADPEGGRALLDAAGGDPDQISAALVARLAHSGDPLSRRLVEGTADGLVIGAAALVNAFNPCRLILGGGVLEGLPELVDRVGKEIARHALPAAIAPLQVLPARLGNQAGVIGAAALALERFPLPRSSSPPGPPG